MKCLTVKWNVTNARFVVKCFARKAIWRSTLKSIYERNLLVAKTAVSDSLINHPWSFTRVCTVKKGPMSVRFVPRNFPTSFFSNHTWIATVMWNVMNAKNVAHNSSIRCISRGMKGAIVERGPINALYAVNIFPQDLISTSTNWLNTKGSFTVAACVAKNWDQ